MKNIQVVFKFIFEQHLLFENGHCYLRSFIFYTSQLIYNGIRNSRDEPLLPIDHQNYFPPKISIFCILMTRKIPLPLPYPCGKISEFSTEFEFFRLWSNYCSE